jgi:hypothetical protein
MGSAAAAQVPRIRDSEYCGIGLDAGPVGGSTVEVAVMLVASVMSSVPSELR